MGKGAQRAKPGALTRRRRRHCGECRTLRGNGGTDTRRERASKNLGGLLGRTTVLQIARACSPIAVAPLAGAQGLVVFALWLALTTGMLGALMM
jgi:hypothetical protein